MLNFGSIAIYVYKKCNYLIKFTRVFLLLLNYNRNISVWLYNRVNRKKTFLPPDVAFFFIFRKTKNIFDFIFKTRTFLSEIWLTLLFGEMTNCLPTSDWLAAIQWPFKGFLGIRVIKALKGLMLKEWNNVKSRKLKTLADSPIEKNWAWLNSSEDRTSL